MNVISYSLFNDDPKYFNFYLRGLYFNLRMAKLLYKDWEVRVAMPMSLLYNSVCELQSLFNLSVFLPDVTNRRCENMLWRMQPCFMDGVDYVICRDLDSVHTWREAKEVEKWIASGKNAHGINDNPAHSIPIMGGMCGFKAAVIREKFDSWDNLISGYDLSRHGSDQTLLMNKVYPLVKDSFYHSYLTNREPQPDKNPLWESDLISRYIGSAGVIDMELLRFLDRHDPENSKYLEFEKKYPNLFYWHL